MTNNIVSPNYTMPTDSNPKSDLHQEFAQHNPDIVALNIDRVDLSWTAKYVGGDEQENDDILFILDRLNRGITRLANGRINTWQLPRSYSAIDAKWDAIDKFLHSLCVGNQQLRDIAIAFCAAILTGRSDLQKFLYLFGSGANGKGAFMSLLSMLVGKENTHSTTMADLNGNQFEPANLKGKRLVVMTDEDKRVGGLSVFKSATGQDPIRYERKGKDASNFIFKGMFVIAANSPTFVGDSNFAIKRRKLVQRQD